MSDLTDGRGWLSDGAAASIARIDAQIGHPLQITEAGRTYAQQQEHYDIYIRDGSPIALPPWTPSIHQLGNAIDTNERNLPVLNANGWVQTVYRDGVLVEPWHFEYSPTRDEHINDQAINPTTTPQEDTMGLRIITGPYYRAADSQVLHNGIVARSIPADVAITLRQGGVPSFDYDADYKFQTELNQVWEMAKLTNETAAKAMVAEFGKQLIE